ncbi:hypothetical protein [Kribbella sp. NBC_00359]|uniref:hypothetical protein n=1 Tax=Kribbella sp. NBC_00359 TaxID=2975966 RepID=UPI002E1E0F12
MLDEHRAFEDHLTDRLGGSGNLLAHETSACTRIQAATTGWPHGKPPTPTRLAQRLPPRRVTVVALNYGGVCENHSAFTLSRWLSHAEGS